MIDSLITLRAVGRSGSFFIHQLLDMHPHLVMLPMNLSFYYHWHYLSEQIKKDPERLILSYMEETNLRYILGDEISYFSYYNEHDALTYLKLNPNEFKAAFLNAFEQISLDNIRKRTLIAIHRAYYALMQWDWPHNAKLYLHEHTPYYFDEVEEDFQQVKQIVSLRLPENSHASYTKFFLAEGGGHGPLHLQYHLRVNLEGWVNAFTYYKQKPENIYFLLIEQLNSNPKNELIRLTHWLEIDYVETLIEPSFLGYACSPNSTENKEKKSQFPQGNTYARRWENICSRREVSLVNTAFRQMKKPFYPELFTYSIGRSLLAIMMPDFRSFRLKRYAFGETIKYILMLNFFWTRMNLIYCLFAGGRAGKGTIQPKHMQRLLAFKYKKYIYNPLTTIKARFAR